MTNLAEHSDDALYQLHNGTRGAFEKDRDIEAMNWIEEAQQFRARFDSEKPNPLEYFGTTEYPDWPTFVQDLEGEMTKRELAFVPIYGEN
jgi:hypothetical protein